LTAVTDQPGTRGDKVRENRSDSSWGLPKLASTAILVSDGLLLLGGVATGWRIHEAASTYASTNPLAPD
jgi:hypothetical protein